MCLCYSKHIRAKEREFADFSDTLTLKYSKNINFPNDFCHRNSYITTIAPL